MRFVAWVCQNPDCSHKNGLIYPDCSKCGTKHRPKDRGMRISLWMLKRDLQKAGIPRYRTALTA